MESDMIKKRLIRMTLFLILVMVLTFLWWGPYQEYFRIRESLKVKDEIIEIKISNKG